MGVKKTFGVGQIKIDIEIRSPDVWVQILPCLLDQSLSVLLQLLPFEAHNHT